MIAPQKYSKGFTLIEVLIAVGIFFLLTGGAVVSYREFLHRQRVIQSAKNVQEAIRIAQKKARAGEKPSGCVTLNGYRVSGTTSSATITVSAVCTNQTYASTTLTLLGSTRLNSSLSLQIQVISGGVTGGGTIRLNETGYTYAFEVNAGGDISEGTFE